MAGYVHILPKIGLKQPSIFRVYVLNCSFWSSICTTASHFICVFLSRI